MGDEDARSYALAKCHAGEVEVEWGPEVKTQIDGMDQEFEVTGVER
jgi:hypothetical protein